MVVAPVPRARPAFNIAWRAGGMESMSNAPYFIPKARGGMRMGHGEIKDHMMSDGLEDAYDNKAMGCFAQGPLAIHSP